MNTFGPFSNIIHKNERMSQLIELASKVSQTDTIVLITGESGTGKELFAQAIHEASLRAQNDLVAINCAAVPETLLEAELFGHEKGAYTGADRERKGKFEQAHGSTLFLDEIGDMSLTAQAKILRAIEERAVERIGGRRTIPVDIRIVASTNQPLLENVRAGKFRSDLYYRLKEIHVELPPLRDRKEDIPILANHFISVYNRQFSKRIKRVADAALEFLRRHDWPGNVRELHHVIKCAVLLAEGDTIWIEHIPLDTRHEEINGGDRVITETRAEQILELLTLEEVEKRHILRILEYTGWNKSQAASILHTSRPTLDRKIERYDLREIRFKQAV